MKMNLPLFKKYVMAVSLVGLLLPASAEAGLLFNYSQLLLKDLDQMNQIVADKVKESRKSSDGKVVPLKEALQAVFSRPNRDGMIDKVVGPLRMALDAEDAWEETITSLTSESINALKNPRAFKPVVQATYYVFLENLISEMKPYADSEGFERGLLVQIRDAKISLSKEVVSERKVRSMLESVSPSDLAAKALESPPPEAKKAP